MAKGWIFEQLGYSGGASANAFRNALVGARIELPELLSREAVQNSVDASDGSNNPVTVNFRTVRHEGDQLVALRDTIGLTASRDDLDRKGLLGGDQHDQPFADRFDRPFESLVIEDFNTTGLGGTHRPIPTQREDKYYRLCMELGGTQDFELHRGGTYGYGKSIAWVASRLWTVILYSRFEPTERTEGTSARFIVVSWFSAHHHEGRRFTGRAWFGDIRKEDGETYAGAITDAEADRLAAKVGFRPRSEEDHGTSLMILDNKVSVEQLKAGAEHSWWPRLLDDRLVIEFDGNDVADPRENPQLSGYIRCWDVLKGRIEPSDGDLLRAESYRRRNLGDLSLTTNFEPANGDSEEGGRVPIAMVRGPGMVVEYHDGPFIQPGHPNVRGFFQADPEIDEILAKSEPPAHNHWDPKTTRSDRELTDQERSLIDRLYEKVNSRTREFLHKHREPPPTPPDRCELLEQLLGKHLRIKKDKPRVDKVPSEFSIRFLEQPHRMIANGAAHIDAKAEISLSKHANKSTMLCRVTCWIESIVEHGKAGMTKPMEFMSVTDPDGDTQQGSADGRKTSADFVLENEDKVVVDMRSAPLDHRDYRARLHMRVEEDR